MDLWHLSDTIIWRSPGMSGQLYTVDKCEIYDVYYYVFCSVIHWIILERVFIVMKITHKINMEVLNCNAHQNTVR